MTPFLFPSLLVKAIKEKIGGRWVNIGDHDKAVLKVLIRSCWQWYKLSTLCLPLSCLVAGESMYYYNYY